MEEHEEPGSLGAVDTVELEPDTGHGRRRLRRVLWWSVSLLALVAIVVGGIFAAIQSRTPKSELAIWQETSPAPTATVVPTPTPTPTESANYDPNRRIGTANDLTYIEASRVELSFFPNVDPDVFIPAIASVSQSEADQIREAYKGWAPPSTVYSILKAHGFDYK